MLNKAKIGIYIILLITIIALLAVILTSPIPQDPSYHNFSDANTILGIPNALNVLSNIPFLIVGLIGLAKLRSKSITIVAENSLAYLIFFFSITLITLGSSYYHLWPSNNTLLWDRLPITLAFMSLFSIVISEFISIKWGKYLLYPLLICGLLSAVYWYFTELQGAGDLRWYGLVQFYPTVIIPIILLSFTPAYTKKAAYWWLIGAYLLAKIFEYFDYFFHSLLTVVSGHSLKHLVSALGLYIILCAYEKRAAVISNTKL